jgi:hypothetical protein
MSPTPAPQPRSLQALRTAVLVLAIFLIAAVVVWIVDGSGGGGSEEATEAPPPGAPRIVTPAELRAAAASAPLPIYWAGKRADAQLELSEQGGGRAYVRYLTGGAAAGDPKPAFLAVATYRLPHALEDLKANAARGGSKLRKAPGGLLAWVDPRRPTSVYLARAGAPYQLEVYDPDPKTALQVALSPQLRPVRGS